MRMFKRFVPLPGVFPFSDAVERFYLRNLAPLIPTAISIWTFIVGALLLFSGAIPPLHGRLHLLQDFISLPVLETSHFLNSLIGTALLFLAWGLARRLRSAWGVAVTALAVSIALSILNGLRYEEAAFALLLLIAMLLCRRSFYRLSYFSGSGIIDFKSFNYRWTGGILIVLAVTVWLGLFAHRHVAYSNQLWWHFAFSDEAPRFLRASLGMSVLFVIFCLISWLRPSPLKIDFSPDKETVKALLSYSPDCSAALALLGDKKFFFSPDRSAAIMFATSGGFWISMGDPVGKEEHARDLLWQFCEEADRRGAKAVFYEAAPKWLDVYKDAGLRVSLMGEEAGVDLKNISESLTGSEWRELRAVKRHLEANGAVFRVADGEERDALLPRLRAVSDEWLTSKHGQEKGFSLGFFDESYLRNFPIALVESNGVPEAFCNLWLGGTGEEFSVDLMRHTAKAPRDVMSYLFIKSMLWGKASGFRYFSLGMAPLSGMHADRSLWEKAGAMIYRHGEAFYNFQGLRAYKEKFNPAWSPRYLVYPAVVDLPLLLPHLIYLISHKKAH